MLCKLKLHNKADKTTMFSGVESDTNRAVLNPNNNAPFIKVTSKRNRKPHVLIPETEVKTTDRTGPRTQFIKPSFDIDVAKTLKQLHQVQVEISASQWFKSALDTIKTNFLGRPQQLVCFGIGHFSQCKISRYQLAFVLALKVEVRLKRITFHEPILVHGEIYVLRSLGIEVYSNNVEGKAKLSDNTEPTLVYLPHCPKQLTNNFLWSNWSPNLLNVCVICNSFEELIDSSPRRFLEVDAQYILRIRYFTNEFRLPNIFRFGDIFNDTSLHVFSNLPQLSDDFWKPNEEPVYAQGATELITQLESCSLQERA